MKDIQKVLEVVKDEINSSINLTQSQITGANIAITKIENLVGGLVEARVSPNFAGIQKEYYDKYIIRHRQNREKTFFSNYYNQPDELWKWFEQKLKEASKISA